MYAVIFSAEIAATDSDYDTMAEQLRERAMAQYGCLAFNAVNEGEQEMAISYWHSLEDIAAWRQDPLHQKAQRLGRDRWYAGYRVQVCEVLKDYNSAPSKDPAS